MLQRKWRLSRCNTLLPGGRRTRDRNHNMNVCHSCSCFNCWFKVWKNKLSFCKLQVFSDKILFGRYQNVSLDLNKFAFEIEEFSSFFAPPSIALGLDLPRSLNLRDSINAPVGREPICGASLLHCDHYYRYPSGAVQWLQLTHKHRMWMHQPNAICNFWASCSILLTVNN